MLLLAHVDRASGLPVRYERPALGDLVHVDIKKLGRIRDGGGWRVHGRVFAQDLEASSRRKAKPLEHERQAHATTAAVDDYSQVVYSKILDDERNQSAAGF